jgi:hypothetical protein
MMLRRLTGLMLCALALNIHSVAAQVTAERLLGTAQEPQNWLTYSGNYASTRYS